MASYLSQICSSKNPRARARATATARARLTAPGIDDVLLLFRDRTIMFLALGISSG